MVVAKSGPETFIDEVTPSVTRLAQTIANRSRLEPGESTLLDLYTFFVLTLTFYVILSLICGMFGVVTNIINIFIFVKRGLFSGGGSLNLFFLALADLGVVFTNLLHGVSWALVTADVRIPEVDLFSVVYLAIGWPLNLFMTINRMVTSYVSFERCMCVVIPFRVQSLFTPRRSLVYLLTIFAYGFLSHIPIYVTHQLDRVSHDGTNVTKLVLIFNDHKIFWQEIVHHINNTILSFLSVVIVFVCTVITSAYVTTSREWRKTTSRNKDSSVTPETKLGAHSDETLSKKSEKSRKIKKSGVDKETRLVKMILTISVIFCVCFIPEMVILAMRTADKRFNLQEQYERLAHILYAIKFLVASVNSSINIFVYYRMSSRYKLVFLLYFGKKESKIK